MLRSGMERNMTNRNKIILISAGAAVLLLILIGVPAALIGSNTRQAEQAAREFTGLLSRGRLAELEARCYMPQSGEDQIIYDEQGTAQARFVTDAELAERFGAEVVLDGRETSPEEELLAVIMEYSSLEISTGLVPAGRASAVLTLTGPDFTSWLASPDAAGEEGAAALIGAGDGLPEAVRELLSQGTVPLRTVRLTIPMQKRDGSWRFQVSDETEDAWFGGLITF